ncbi:MAG TPA: outer membrane protein transport protein, partial [Methylophilus sp.]
VTVLKLGAQYAYSDSLTLRAGYNHSSQPVRSQDAFINILAPGVVQDHVTLGATYTLADKSELSFFYAHAFSDKVRGDGAIPALFGGGDVDLRMNQNSLGIAYGWKL